MQACTLRVECLSQEAAWELFRQKLGEDVLNSHPDIPKLAKIVLNECKGLPLALITIGRAMACRRKPEEWQHAIKVLQSYPSKFSGMGDVVFPTLKFSYDSLCSDTLKTCFLYCSVFPEDHDIEENELIELWIGEGFLEEFGNIYDARNEGKYIIGSLKLPCLLETGEKGDNYVKMHDVLRDMALWLASEKNIGVLVQEHVELSEAESMMAKWQDATRISLWNADTKSFTEAPSCSNLLTLLVRDSELVTRFPNNFFQSMRLLNVLDLSWNRCLIELPAEIGELVHLQYLNLSYTGIKMLPVEVKKLTRLRILHLEGMFVLQTISAGVISCLLSLQVFCGSSWRSRRTLFVDVDLLQALEGLEHINDISFMLFCVFSIDKFLFSPKLIACTTSLRIKFPEDSHPVVLPLSNMKRMENLEIIGCDSLVELKFYGPEDEERMINRSIMPNYLPSLRNLCLRMCPIKDLTWLIHVPSLSSIVLGDCPLLDEVISCDFGSSEIEQAVGIFPNLTYMVLSGLPNLKSICRQAMPFPSLKLMHILSCPTLRNLPFNSDSAKSSCLKIEGRREWWEQLEWEDETTKHLFTSKFCPINILLQDLLV